MELIILNKFINQFNRLKNLAEMQGFFGIYFIAFKKLFTMKKTFTILVSLLVTASVYSQTYNVNTFYAELGGYVIKTVDYVYD